MVCLSSQPCGTTHPLSLCSLEGLHTLYLCATPPLWDYTPSISVQSCGTTHPLSLCSLEGLHTLYLCAALRDYTPSISVQPCGTTHPLSLCNVVWFHYSYVIVFRLVLICASVSLSDLRLCIYIKTWAFKDSFREGSWQEMRQHLSSDCLMSRKVESN